MMNIAPANVLPVFVMLGITGGLINATQTTMYALAANVYPTNIRATGVGTTVAVGRIGGVLSPVVGGSVLALGTQPYFLSIVATMSVTFIALAMVRRHVPRPVFGTKASMATASGH
jgi:AAHS family 4-hydroxybenzoate transporter-like MFS transporter